MEQLKKVRKFVSEMRENGDADLRTVLWLIDELIENPDFNPFEEEEN